MSTENSKKQSPDLTYFIVVDDNGNRRIGFRDHEQKEVIPPVYYVMLKLQNGKTIFNHGGDFKDGLAVMLNREGKFGLIDTKGNTVVPFRYDHVSNTVENGMIFFRLGNTCGFMKMDTSVVVEYPNCTVLVQTHDHVYHVEYNFGETQTEIDLDKINT